MNTENCNEFTYIDTQADLLACLDTLKAQPVIAIDMEADSYHHYYPKVCLLQCTAGPRNFIIDPLADVNMPALLAVLADKPLILHDAGYDLRMLKADFDFCPNDRILDTMLAGKLLGIEKVGLSNMLEMFLGIQVAKHNQRADWSQRPLDPHLLAYAAEDTCWLPALWEKLQAALDAKGRLDWHRQYCEFSTQTALEAEMGKNGDDEDRWRIRGLQKLSPKEMAFFRELWHWREKEASKIDIPPFRVFENTRLMELAARAAAGKTSMKDIGRLLPRTCKGRRLDALKKAFRAAADLPPSQYPLPRKGDVSKKLTGAQQRQIESLKEECVRIGEALELPSQMIAARGALEWIVRKQAGDPRIAVEKRVLMPWQADLLAPALKTILTRPETP